MPGVSNGPIAKVQSSFPLKESDAQQGLHFFSTQVVDNEERSDREGLGVLPAVVTDVVSKEGDQVGADGSSFEK